MQKLVPFCAAISAAFILSSDLVSANSFNITTNTSNSTGEVLTGTSESVSVSANISLTVSGSAAGILTNNGNNNGVMVTINNLGAIEQTGTGNGVQDANGHETIILTNGSSSNSVASLKADGGDAIHLSKSSDNATVNNYGQILSVTGGQGIDMSGMTNVPSGSGGNTTINNYATGVIEGEANDGIQTAVGAYIYNDGQITAVGSSSDGINAGSNSGLTIVNANAINGDTTGAGSITGGHHGITGGNTGTFDGTVQTTPTTSAALGSYVGLGTYTMSVTNNAGGTISGGDGSGINIDGFGIQGTQIAGTSNYRLVTNESVSVTNHGTITGYGNDRDGDGIDVDGDVTVDNFGTIQSENATPETGESGPEFSEGITVGGGTITNEVGAVIHGYVQSTNTQGVGRGITLAGVDKASNDTAIPIESIYENSTITNSGTIQGGTGSGTSGGESGIAVLGTTGGGYTVMITNNVTGTIEGNNTGVSEDSSMVFNGQTVASGQSLNQGAIELDDTGNTYVITNMGKIIQDNANGTAIEMRGASNTLNVMGGSAQIVGNIAGDTATDSTLTINPGAGNSFKYGYSISNFTVKINSDGSNGTVTLSGANTYSGTTTVSGGMLVIDNPSGSGTGTGKVSVAGGAAIGGTGIIQPGSGNGIKLGANGILISGDTQTSTTAGNGLTLDNTVAQGVILDASIGSANLSFSLGANHSATTMSVLGNTTGELKFAAGDTITVNDLTSGNLQFNLNTPYLLIQAGTTPSLLADNDLYAGITTTGGTDGSGNILNGYVTTPLTLTINGGSYSNVKLYLNNGDLEVVPEPGTWSMMLGGLAAVLFLQFRRRQRQG